MGTQKDPWDSYIYLDLPIKVEHSCNIHVRKKYNRPMNAEGYE